jgi:hypothetical protein
MRIIHGHDYYDSALAYGQDDSIVLVRQKSNLLTDEQVRKVPYLFGAHASLLATHPSWRSSPSGFEIMDYTRPIGRDSIVARPCKVWVAGSEWNGVCLDVTSGGTTKRTHAWSWQNLLSWGEAHGVAFPTRQGTTDRWERRRNITPDWFGEKASHADLISWMIQNRTSIITCNPGFSNRWYADHEWRVNGDNLRAMEFYKAADAFSLFQKISQWVGGVLPSTANQMVEIKDDLIKVHKHGFDKWSFRKLPQGGNK